MARVVFMGTPDFAVPSLESLLKSQTVVGVVTQPDRPAGRGRHLQPPPIKVVAQAAGVPIYQPKSLRSEESLGPLRQWSPEIIVVAAFGQILRPHLLELPSSGCLNVHASLLPRWRGAAPIQHALLAGDRETGVSLMQVDVGLDTGPVYVQESIPIQADDTAASLHDRLAQLGAGLLTRHLDDILGGRVPATPQDDAMATYAPMIEKEDGRIDWTRSNVQIDRHIRAMSPWPGAFTFWQGQMLKVLSAAPVSTKHSSSDLAGTVVAFDDAAVVLTGEGALLLKTIQLAGKRATTIEAFLLGRPNFPGSRLGN